MPDGVSVEIQGLAELDRKLRQFGPRLARNGLRAAVNAGAQVIKKDARNRAPVDTGRLSKKAIYVKRIREEVTFTREAYAVGVRFGKREQQKDRDAFYWRWIEFGTKFKAARPFIRPAFESKKFEALQRIKEKLIERIEKLSRQS